MLHKGQQNHYVRNSASTNLGLEVFSIQMKEHKQTDFIQGCFYSLLVATGSTSNVQCYLTGVSSFKTDADHTDQMTNTVGANSGYSQDDFNDLVDSVIDACDSNGCDPGT